jgi:hypothetical protein
MTTPKRNITNHKRSPAKAGHSGAQVFDIIPRSQVRPSVTARPVLTPTRPEQSDNTLQTTSQAASSQLKHGTLSFTPSAPELADGDAEALLDQVASITAEVDKAVNKPKAIDKLETESDAEPKLDDEPGHEHEAASKTDAETEDQAEAKNEAIDINEAKATDEATSPTGPIEDSEDSENSKNSEDPEKAEAEKVDGEGPAEIPEEPAAAADADPETSSGTTDTDIAKPAKTDTSEKKTGDKEPADGSIDHIFKDDTQTIEHSQALKDELQTMDDKPEEGVHPHHELYGGKPVIVIHKAHSAHSALNWILWFIFCVLLALVIVDVLLDAGVITTDYSVPHTHYLQ